MNSPTGRLTRRRMLQIGTFTGAAVLLGRTAVMVGAEATLPLITRTIPATGEKLPAVGLGTNNYNVTSDEDLALRRDVLRRMPEMGGTLVDTAPAYGRSEEVIGRLVSEIGNRDRLFYATKVTAPDDDVAAGRAMLEQSFRRLRTERIELIEVHNLMGTDVMMPVLQEMKTARRIRYLGATTSNDAQHAAMSEALRRHRLDFIQVNYSLDDREAADRLLPQAQDGGVAVLLNMPFGGRRGSNMFARVANRPLARLGRGIRRAELGPVLPEVRDLSSRRDLRDSRHDQALASRGQSARRPGPPARGGHAQPMEKFWGELPS